MANSQESDDNRSGDPIKMSHSTMNRFITDLNKMSAILQYDKPIPADAKQRTCKKIEESILAPFQSTQSDDDSRVFEERISDQLTVQLSRAERARIVSHLIDIKDVLYDDKISRAAKDSLVSENRRFIGKLLSLPCRVQSDTSCGDKCSEDEKNDEPPLKKQKMNRFILDTKTLNSIRVSRHKLSQWCHSPFFRDTVIGCFVRLSIGVDKNKTPIYRVAEIVDVLDGPNAYELKRTKTDKLLKVKHGGDEKSLRIIYVSNAEINEQEFVEWRQKMAKECLSLPSKKQIDDKTRRLKDALSNFKESDIEAFACEKEKNMAQTRGVLTKVEELTMQLDEVEKKAIGLNEELIHVEARRKELKDELTTITRAEVSFEFELVAVSKFFEDDSNKFESNRFWFLSLQWSVYVKPHLKDDHLKYLELFLHCHNDERQKRSCKVPCKVNCKLILFSNLSNDQNYYFIGYRKLTDGKAGYIKDDKIVLAVELKAGGQ